VPDCEARISTSSTADGLAALALCIPQMVPYQESKGVAMKKITVRKAGAVRLTTQSSGCYYCPW